MDLDDPPGLSSAIDPNFEIPSSMGPTPLHLAEVTIRLGVVAHHRIAHSRPPPLPHNPRSPPSSDLKGHDQGGHHHPQPSAATILSPASFIHVGGWSGIGIRRPPAAPEESRRPDAAKVSDRLPQMVSNGVVTHWKAAQWLRALGLREPVRVCALDVAAVPHVFSPNSAGEGNSSHGVDRTKVAWRDSATNDSAAREGPHC